MIIIVKIFAILNAISGLVDCDYFVMEIVGDEKVAKEIAVEIGLQLHWKLFPDQEFYLLQSVNNISREKRSLDIEEDNRILSFEKQNFRFRVKRMTIKASDYLHEQSNTHNVLGNGVQCKNLNPNSIEKCHYKTHSDTLDLATVVLQRVKKGTIEDKANFNEMTFDDPYFPHQWYVQNFGQNGIKGGHDLNVLTAWKMGWTGAGVTVSVLDDGVQHTNLDIKLNYEPSISVDVTNLTNLHLDPAPTILSRDNSHGTYCAAIIAAVANNSYCGVGIAFNAKIGGVRLLDGPVSDVQEAVALNYGLDQVDIFSASWGPKDDGSHVEGPGKLAATALERGVTHGRNKKGVIYVWAVGNGGLSEDNCNLDGYTSSRYTLSVSALTELGFSVFYGEPCASTLASVYVRGSHAQRNKQYQKNINVVVPELNGDCRDSFQGTSAAAPIAAGIIALVLEANSNLTWRDVQHIVVHTAKKINNEPGWRSNGARLQYHLMYGFGAMDAAKMIQAALTWKNVPPVIKKSVLVTGLPRTLPPLEESTLNISVNKTDSINVLEHVIAIVDLEHEFRCNLEIFLVSPAGTVSQVLTLRGKDNSGDGFKKWGFMSVHFWGEQSTGRWKLVINNTSTASGLLHFVELQYFGFAET